MSARATSFRKSKGSEVAWVQKMATISQIKHLGTETISSQGDVARQHVGGFRVILSKVSRKRWRLTRQAQKAVCLPLVGCVLVRRKPGPTARWAPPKQAGPGLRV